VYVWAQEKDLREEIERMNFELRTHGTNVEQLRGKIVLLEKEKSSLIEVAIRCKFAQVRLFSPCLRDVALPFSLLDLEQMRLKSIYNQYKNEADLAKLLFGDMSYKTVVRGHSRAGPLNKMGGTNAKKWAMREFILNDFLLFYYATQSDKEPKGIIRMDHAVVEKCDLASMGRRFGIKIVMVQGPSTGRDYFLEAISEQEQSDWVNSLEQSIALV
jgi:hypothetical protein